MWTRLGIIAAPAVGLLLAHMHRQSWVCIDDPITWWAALRPATCLDVIKDAALTGHLPTFFLLVRVASEWGGDGAARLFGSVGPWLCSVVLAQRLCWTTTASRAASLVVGIAVATAPHFVPFGLCLRPYAWLLWLVMSAALGLVEIHRERRTQGLCWVAIGAGLLPHASTLGFAVAGVSVGLAAWSTWTSTSPRQRVLWLGTVAVLWAPALFKLCQLHAEPAYHSWMRGSPWTLLWLYPLMLLLCATIAHGCARRSKWRVGREVILQLSLIGLANPLSLLCYGWLAQQPLVAPWYHVPEVAVGSCLLGMAVGSISGSRKRAFLATALAATAIVGSHRILEAFEAVAAPLKDRTRAFEHVAANASPGDLVVVASPYVEGSYGRYYGDALHRSYLLADALRAIGRDGVDLRLFPGPAGHVQPPSGWAEQLRQQAEGSERVWALPRPSWSVVWRPTDVDEPSTVLRTLAALGYRAVEARPRDGLDATAVLLIREGETHGSESARLPQRARSHRHSGLQR